MVPQQVPAWGTRISSTTLFTLSAQSKGRWDMCQKIYPNEKLSYGTLYSLFLRRNLYRPNKISLWSCIGSKLVTVSPEGSKEVMVLLLFGLIAQNYNKTYKSIDPMTFANQTFGRLVCIANGGHHSYIVLTRDTGGGSASTLAVRSPASIIR